jgi:hypothetical protein
MVGRPVPVAWAEPRRIYAGGRLFALEFVAPVLDAVFPVGIDIAPQRIVFLAARGERGGSKQD